MTRRRKLVVPAAAALVVAAVAALSACSGGDDSEAAPTAEPAAAVCPKASRADWQKLADEIDARVYCPGWLPQPFVGKFGGRFFNGRSVDPDRSYLISWLWFENSGGLISEVHVNLRAYPGKTAIPTCQDTLNVNGKIVRKKLPCFSDPEQQKKRFGPITATVYTANRDADSWHVLYAWRNQGSLYTLSEHVALPYTYEEVVANLDEVMRKLVAVDPKA